MLKIIVKLAENLAVHVREVAESLRFFVWRRDAINVSDRSRQGQVGCGLGQVPQSCVWELASDGCRSDIERSGWMRRHPTGTTANTDKGGVESRTEGPVGSRAAQARRGSLGGPGRTPQGILDVAGDSPPVITARGHEGGKAGPERTVAKAYPGSTRPACRGGQT